jgi:hypothetical protein
MKHIKKFENYDEKSEHNIDIILNSYLECVIFTEEGHQEDNKNDPFEGKSIYDFSDDSKIEAIEQIEWFVDAAGESLDDISDDSIGYNIWYTRNGHGVGFWDRGYKKDVEDTLCHLCEVLGYADTWVGSNGKIHIDTTKNYKNFDLEHYNLEKRSKKYNL